MGLYGQFGVVETNLQDVVSSFELLTIFILSGMVKPQMTVLPVLDRETFLEPGLTMEQQELYFRSL
jgi:hypothetical protein